MNDQPLLPSASWRHAVSLPPRRRHRHAFSRSTVSMGALIHVTGMMAGLLATDRMRDPSTRWATIAGFGLATGIGETIWRERIEAEREREEKEQGLGERP